MKQTICKDLVLDGEADALTLLSIKLDGKDLVEGNDYTLKGDTLTIPAKLLGDTTSKLEYTSSVNNRTNLQYQG